MSNFLNIKLKLETIFLLLSLFFWSLMLPELFSGDLDYAYTKIMRGDDYSSTFILMKLSLSSWIMSYLYNKYINIKTFTVVSLILLCTLFIYQPLFNVKLDSDLFSFMHICVFIILLLKFIKTIYHYNK